MTKKRKIWRCNQIDLFNAAPKCNGLIIAAVGGGIKCTKCRGWFCF
jgi:hypothetical protein